MAASMSDVQRWFHLGVKGGKTHLVVFCDTFSHDDYPVYFTGSPHEVRDMVATTGDHVTQKLMEVYHLGSSMDSQLAEHRAHNYEPLPVAPETNGKEDPVMEVELVEVTCIGQKRDVLLAVLAMGLDVRRDTRLGLTRMRHAGVAFFRVRADLVHSVTINGERMWVFEKQFQTAEEAVDFFLEIWTAAEILPKP